MNKWTHRRTHITETYIPIDNPSSSVSSSSDNLHAKKVKPGFHAELINNKNAAKWLESTMTTDLAKLHLYNLFLDIRRLQGHEVKFGPDICNKIHNFTPEMDVAQKLHEQTVDYALKHVFDKRKKDSSPPSLPPNELTVISRPLYSEAVKSESPAPDVQVKPIPSSITPATTVNGGNRKKCHNAHTPESSV